MAPVYVLMCSLRPNVGAAGLKRVVKDCVELVLENNAIVRNVRNNGIRKMGYKLDGKGEAERHSRTHMFSMEFIAPPALVPEIHKRLAIDDDVIRSTTLRADETLPRFAPLLKKYE
ncbi:28S ribosomal protein S6, mitochondrial [Hondaea fermentalgiana]|uniref:28S ribosomal protein S6, mitochondrial n=1 Tax=Hondaea fermentalgiana TaxID=2315210 RepID=A0A2R5GWJ0_9STRA|nr:28S ribosomal protein S6, mitochondrial [Hondaea fermentalgiana]|eukprot:GBG32304.1 28S ribosomal protein S6, mitochondrial [Hondaea fermentalgiana]